MKRALFRHWEHFSEVRNRLGCSPRRKLGLVLADWTTMAPALRSLRHRAQRGVTLLEVLIASTIVSIAFLGFFGMQSQIISSSDDARKMTECETLVDTKLDQLRSIRWCQTAGDPLPAELTVSTSTDPAESGGDEWSLGGGDHQEGGYGADINLAGDTTDDPGRGAAVYRLSWRVEDLAGTDQVYKLKVKCSYALRGSTQRRGIEIMSYYMGNDC